MKHLSRRILFSPAVLVSRFSTSSSSGAHHSSGRHDEVWRNVRVCVWWDFENCHLPSGVNVFKVGQAITGALRANGIKGPVQITAFGDVLQLSRANQEALSATGITLNHIPSGGKNSSDRSLLVDLLYWVSQNPPPAHLFLISGDRDFASILHRLRMSNYNILLAATSNAPGVLCSAASIMWNWNSLLKMEGLKGTHFNLPPDGSYGSWYGNSKVLEDPFAVIEQPRWLPCENLSASSSELQVRPIPEAVQRQICDIVNLHPDGISIADLGNELKKRGVPLVKHFYGSKKLSCLILSMQNVLELQCMKDGQHIIRGISGKGLEPFVPSQSSVTKNQLLPNSSKVYGKDASVSKPVDVKTSWDPSSKEQLRKIEKNQPLAEQAAKMDRKSLVRAEHSSLVGENVDFVNGKLTDSSSSVKDKNVTSEGGSFEKWLKKILFGEGVDISEIKSSHFAKEVQISGDICDQRTLAVKEKCVTSGDCAGNAAKVSDLKSPAKVSDSVKPASCSVSTVEPVLETKTAFDSDAYEKISGKGLGLFSRVLNWFKYKSSWPNSERSSDEPSQELEHNNSSSGKHHIFAEDSFWKDLESFMDTKNALLVISKSKTRQQIAQNLQKEGPLVVRTLKESDILELIDMLISEKKWVEECSSEASPFKLIRCVQSQTSSTTGSPSNGLPSLFSSQHANPNLKSGDRRIQNVSHTGVKGKFVVTNRTHLGRTKKEMLNDCHKLANEIVEQFPEGYCIGSFRKLFLEKYGYDLDIQKLGYDKLACFLQTIPGLKIESSIIIPASKALKSEVQGTAISDSIKFRESRESGCESSGASEKDDVPESLYDELGPVTKIGSERFELGSLFSGMRRKDTRRQVHTDYEPLLSDKDDWSDSDEEYKVASQKNEQSKPVTTESGSIMEILRSRDDDDQGDDKKRGKSDDVQGESDSAINSLETSNPCGRGTKLRNSSGNPQKEYSFVANTGGSTAEKQFKTNNKGNVFVDSVRSSLKKD